VRALYEMRAHGDEANKRDAEVMVRNIFYEFEDYQLLIKLVKEYVPHKATRRYGHHWANIV